MDINIPNVTITEKYYNGVLRGYDIAPDDGYVLHDKELDAPAIDEYGEPTGETALGYTTGSCSCGANYDFAANPREFYAVLRESVPADQIFSNDAEHEVL